MLRAVAGSADGAGERHEDEKHGVGQQVERVQDGDGSDDDVLQTLRGPQHFGQYGKIIKIVVSKAKEGSSTQSLGIYVTFASKEDAKTCIAALDGSLHEGRVLRYGHLEAGCAGCSLM